MIRSPLFVLLLSLLVLPSLARASDSVGEQVLPLARRIAADAEIVRAVRSQNARGLSLTALKALDARWMAAAGLQPFMKPYLENACVSALRRATRDVREVVEAFVTDNQGGLVGTLRRTSDYWQGDEDKWVRAFSGGAGAEIVDSVQFDESIQSYAVQVSVPVRDRGRAAGVLTVTIALDLLPEAGAR